MVSVKTTRRGARPRAPTENKTFSLFPGEPPAHDD